MNLGAWSIQAPAAYVALAGLLYWLGGLRWRRRAVPGDRLRTAAFVAGLVTIVLALDSPIDAYADELFWVHMLQHVLLLTVAPPLILLGRPWPRMWRALPLSTRTTVGRTIARARWTAPLRRLAQPVPAWLLFNATVVLWHIPAAYNATLTDGPIHQVEHAMFFFTGLLFWARVIDPGPLRPKLVWPARLAYAIGAMVVGWVLAITLVLVPHPLYAHYAALAQRPGGITALTDQQIAGGIMWVPGSIAYTVALLIGFYRWLEADSKPASRPGLGGSPERDTEPALGGPPERDAEPALGGPRSATPNPHSPPDPREDDMASILVFGSFLAGSLISLLIPVGLLIAIAVWHTRSFMRIPHDPAQTAAHAAGVAEKEGRGVIPQDEPRGPTT